MNTELNQILSQLSPEQRKEAQYLYDERVAIMIHDGFASQEDAEREGVKDVKRWAGILL